MPARRLKVLLIPPERWQPARDKYVPGLSPAEGQIDRLLAEHHGIDMELLDPYTGPLNPLSSAHPVYQGLDIARTAKILTSRRSVDLVLSVFESSPTLLLLARKLAHFQPKIAIWDIAPDEEWRTRKIIQNIVIPRVDHLFLLSSNQQEYVERRWGAASKTSVVWQHVDTDFFRPTGVHSDSGPVLAIGDDHGRDWETFIKAVADLDIDVIAKTRKNLDLPPCMRCRFQQIRERLSFMELRDLYARCRLVVIPLKSTLNVSGVGSLLEAMAMGKAIVISDNPPIRDYLVPNESCSVVPIDDADAMRLGIEHLLGSTQQLQAHGDAARARAVSLYSKPVFAQRLAEHIRMLANESF